MGGRDKQLSADYCWPRVEKDLSYIGADGRIRSPYSDEYVIGEDGRVHYRRNADLCDPEGTDTPVFCSQTKQEPKAAKLGIANEDDDSMSSDSTVESINETPREPKRRRLI